MYLTVPQRQAPPMIQSRNSELPHEQDLSATESKIQDAVRSIVVLQNGKGPTAELRMEHVWSGWMV